jgi:transcriptional regulator with GAF, ATPase, and Fis domain
MSMLAPRSDAATPLSYTPRRRDRRRGVEALLTIVSRALERRDEVVRGTFEEMLGRLVPVRSVQMRELPERWDGQLETGPESIAFEIPASHGAQRAVLEATLNPGCRLGEWDYQLLDLATHVGALVLEIDRSRLQPARAGAATLAHPKRNDATRLIGSSPNMRSLRRAIERVAMTDFTVLLEGESGVGKELVARQVHQLGRRRDGPFVAVNCAALVETLLEAELFGIEERTATGVRGRRGKFEHADGGTLFLDEVSDLSLSAQAKLLRVVQDLSVERVGGHGTHRVDVRIVAATNRSLSELVERRLFRPDLFYRLSGVDIRVPPLRDRRTDILELSQHFLERHRSTRALTLSPAAAEALASYHWPGNVRELERLIERAVTLAESNSIALDDLPPTVRGDYAAALIPSLIRNDTMRAWGSRYARLMLDRCHGNKREACRVLGLSYHTLQAYLRYPLDEAQGGGEAGWNGVARPANEPEKMPDACV